MAKQLILKVESCRGCTSYYSQHLMSKGGCMQTNRAFKDTEDPDNCIAEDCPLDDYVEPETIQKDGDSNI